MDTILAKRNLANQQNTAQSIVNRAIERLVGSARETEFVVPTMPLYGEVNFSVLNRLNVKSIITKERGYITDVRGLPNGLSNLRIDRQLLFEVKGLPQSLETLNLDGNYIESIDLSNFYQLKVVSIRNNRLKSLGELPASLEELYVDNNNLSRLDLKDLEKLRVLHCRNNHLLHIENIPASMVDLVVEDGNPHVVLDYAFIPSTNASEDNKRVKGTEPEFVEALHKYFQLKTKYEDGARAARMAVRMKAIQRGLGEKQARKMAASIRPKCVNCKRPVGTIFRTREDRLFAHCGDTNDPCALRIELFKGHFESNDAFAKSTRDELLSIKERIIQQKMDVLFNYASEEETVQKFKELIEEYNLVSFLHKIDVDVREDKRFNVHKKELIKGKIQRINELKSAMNVQMDDYNESSNRDSLHTAMNIYIHEYLPEIHNLRMLKYSVMEMVIPNADSETLVRALNQSSASMRELENIQGEIPRIIKFVVGQHKEEDEPAEDEADNESEENVIPFSSNDESLSEAKQSLRAL